MSAAATTTNAQAKRTTSGDISAQDLASPLPAQQSNDPTRKRANVESGLRVMQTISKPVPQQAQAPAQRRQPTATEIENFQVQLSVDSIKSLSARLNEKKLNSSATTMNYQNFRECLQQEFRVRPAPEHLHIALFNRFRQFKVKENSEGIELAAEMDIIDFLLGMNILSRIPVDHKIKLMFELCDNDDDGCMNPFQILQMLQKVERLFTRESARIDIGSQVLLNGNADQKAEMNFHFIMAVIRQQAIKKIFVEHMKLQQAEEQKVQGRKVTLREIKAKMAANALPIDLTAADQDQDNLITYREFILALKGAKESLYYKILPRTLSFAAVLESTPSECEFEISDLHIDDFYMFRYELHTINKKHFFTDEKKTEVQMFGKHPLSNYEGVSPIKDLLKDLRKGERIGQQERDEMQRKCQEIFVPPGIIHSYETAHKKTSTLHNDIKNVVPNDNIFKRQKLEQRISGGYKSVVSPTTQQKSASAVLQNQPKINKTPAPRGQSTIQDDKVTLEQEKDRQQQLLAMYKEYHLEVQYDKEQGNDVNFERLFQDNLPAEAIDLREYLRKYKEKDQTKEFNIDEIKTKAFGYLDKCRGLVPDGVTLSMWLMADDSVKPKNKQL